MGLITIIPPIEIVSFGYWYLMPMGTHKSRVVKHDYWSGKGIATINIGYKVPTHSLNIQIVLQINIWEIISTCSCKQGINPLQYPTLVSWIKALCEVNHSNVNCSWLRFPMVSQMCQSNENVAHCWQDLLGLLGFDLQLQNLIIEKIHWFMSKIAHDHRVISNLYNFAITKELEDIWYNFDVGHDCKQILDSKHFIHYLSLHIFM
jgi:hypothetical protein